MCDGKIVSLNPKAAPEEKEDAFEWLEMFFDRRKTAMMRFKDSNLRIKISFDQRWIDL